MIDITNHPLTEFFRLVAAEYDRGMAKYGRWSDLTEKQQAQAVQAEYLEWKLARKTGDTTGDHGELAELPQLANVAGRRWRVKRKESHGKA